MQPKIEPTNLPLRTKSNGAATIFDGKTPLKTFVEKVIKAKRKPKYKGVHVVYSSFNDLFREYYGVDPRPYIDALAEEGFITKVIVKGGAIITLMSDLTDEEKSSHVSRTRLRQEIDDILK